MNFWSHKLLQNTFKNITKKVLLPVFVFFSLPAGLVEAQITPDGTLESAVQQLQELMRITGGQREGNNLFHSFESFSVPEGMEASFENALDIQNIFTRVTGDSVSNIAGTLSAQGGANLFLMNPNGIVFGQDASINIGGSFIATTADSIQFNDGVEFAATSTEDPTPLLTNEIPIGLGFGSNTDNGAIEAKGTGNKISSDSIFAPIDVENTETGLSVPSGETLALIGDDVALSGSIITSEGGKIEIGSVDSGSVSLQKTENELMFGYENVSTYGDIDLTKQAFLNTSGEGSGAMSLTGNNVLLSDGSFLLNQNRGNIDSGKITIKAIESLSLLGTSSNNEVSSSIRSESLNEGQASSINISTAKLLVDNEGQIRTTTYGKAPSNDVVINSSNSIKLLNRSSVSASTFTEANAGKVELSTNEFRIINGSTVTSSTVGTGSGGEVIINSDVVEVSGVSFSDGNDRSSISSSTFADGNAGRLEINTANLRVKDGGTVGSSSFANGDAGSFVINSSESIEVSGINNDFPSSIKAAVEPPVTEAAREALGLPEVPKGSFGDIVINTPSLNIYSGGEVSVRNQGTGNAGTISIDADDINLDDASSIIATSASGTGGNIELNANELSMDNKSQVTATAGNEAEGGNININATNITAKKNSAISANATGGNGGNITIGTETLLGLQNSDITANAVEGDGGNITITADAIFGFEERASLTPLSDITASSELGSSGTVTINSPETESEEEAEVSAREVDPIQARKIIVGCDRSATFARTGKGVPMSPHPAPFGWIHDPLNDVVFEEAKKTAQNQRIRQALRRGATPEEVQKMELEQLQKERLQSSNRHQYLSYNIAYDKQDNSVIIPAPKGTLTRPKPLADSASDTITHVFHSSTNQKPPLTKVKKLQREPNVMQINPDGSRYLVHMTNTPATVASSNEACANPVYRSRAFQQF